MLLKKIKVFNEFKFNQIFLGKTGRRGVCGTILIHKIAGYLAETKKFNLDEIVSKIEVFNQRIQTYGVALSSCHVPGKISENRIKNGMVELGLGIHNEPGFSIFKSIF